MIKTFKRMFNSDIRCRNVIYNIVLLLKMWRVLQTASLSFRWWQKTDLIRVKRTHSYFLIK